MQDPQDVPGTVSQLHDAIESSEENDEDSSNELEITTVALVEKTAETQEELTPTQDVPMDSAADVTKELPQSQCGKTMESVESPTEKHHMGTDLHNEVDMFRDGVGHSNKLPQESFASKEVRVKRK